MAALVDRRAFSDHHALVLLGRGRVPTIEETRRRIFIAERRTDVGRPDHFYKGYVAERLRGAETVSELPALVLRRLSDRFLYRRDGRVAVRTERFVEWHETLPYISPLAVIVAYLVDEGRGPNPGTDPRPFLATEIGDTALLGPVDHALNDLVERKGLFELHMHLNGSTELDVLWPVACRDPDAFYRELKAAYEDSPGPSAELYEQMEPGLGPLSLYRRLRAARRVRRQIAAEIAQSLGILTLGAGVLGHPTLGGLAGLLRAMEAERGDGTWQVPAGGSLRVHPARLIHPTEAGYPNLVEEAAFLYACLLALRARPTDPVVGTGLYYNLVLLNQLGRIVVQQADETGFDQFQKYTLIGARSGIERRYEMRFRQIGGREPFDTLAHLEGRFAPKGSVAETHALVATIVGDYLAFRGCAHATRHLRGTPPPCLVGRPCPIQQRGAGQAPGTGTCAKRGRAGAELSLVAHFIKRPTRPGLDRARGCRDSELRLTLRVHARALQHLVRGNRTARALLRGIDAASNELHAPPEPFAPAFRLARSAGIPRSTFHVGEDFRHLASGIRAVAEALSFLDLQAGDRIGHATALGIAPAVWVERTAPRSYLSRTEALDDAVFTHRLLAEKGGFERDLLRLERDIATYSAALYSEERSPALLHRAWELRCLDALEMRSVERSVVRSGRPATAATVASEAERMARVVVDPVRAAELVLIAERVAQAGGAYDIYLMRHRLKSADHEAQVEVEATLVAVDALEAMQDLVLGEVNRRGVAIEALPTSNARISLYRTVGEHHLFRWLGLSGPPIANRPTVVIGSDDPGIFATSLRNEYATLAAVLRDQFGVSAPQAGCIIERLGDNARTFRFRPDDRF